MDQNELFQRLAVALAIGLLIGLERGWQTRDESDRHRTAGLLTFALTGLLGAICGLLASAVSPIVLAAGGIAYTIALVTFSYMEASAEKNFSVTGVVAGILTFMLGAYAVVGNVTVTVAASVAMAILLALRDPLHTWVRTITWPEIRSALVLLAMSFLLLPVLPNRTIDPWEVLNPAEIWLLAILIAAISFAGYIAVRVLGERRGIALAAIAGGLASSTATTVSFARLARTHPESTHVLAGGILLASMTMMARILVLVGMFKPEMLGTISAPITAAAGVTLIGTAVLYWAHREGSREQPQLIIKNPLDLGAVFWLVALLAAIMLVAKVLAVQTGSAGVYVLAGFSGIVDVDALTLSMTRLAGMQVPMIEASTAILIAAVSNTVSKAVIATAIGGSRLGVAMGMVSTLAVAALVAALLFGSSG
ncbi:MgtC/SapB family protein [uncultured Hyphomicrobium sp.]|jgi:uncharacterized membrane protein (DUF4010 family)|uniref:MgtC/SapB family protein n=1 Tax=uncultured Hyphomicrobium sp. TaxID=194373 RepID=UPI0025EDE018|nr:MgtC/SapB family protein [uncultured Hyphomicrobium sp.]